MKDDEDEGNNSRRSRSSLVPGTENRRTAHCHYPLPLALESTREHRLAAVALLSVVWSSPLGLFSATPHREVSWEISRVDVFPATEIKCIFKIAFRFFLIFSIFSHQPQSKPQNHSPLPASIGSTCLVYLLYTLR